MKPETGIYITDVALLQHFKTDKNEAFVLLYEKYRKPLLAFSIQYLGDRSTCEDIIQDLFASLYSNANKLHIRSSLSSYLFTALKNRIRNHLRYHATYNRHISVYRTRIKTISDPVSHFESADLQKKIPLLLHRFPEKYRHLYHLHYKNELSIKEVSGILNKSVSTVEKQAKKLNCFLREQLKASLD